MRSRTSAEFGAELGRTPGQAVGPYLTSSYGVGGAEGMVEATIRVCFPLRRNTRKTESVVCSGGLALGNIRWTLLRTYVCSVNTRIMTQLREQQRDIK